MHIHSSIDQPRVTQSDKNNFEQLHKLAKRGHRKTRIVVGDNNSFKASSRIQQVRSFHNNDTVDKENQEAWKALKNNLTAHYGSGIADKVLSKFSQRISNNKRLSAHHVHIALKEAKALKSGIGNVSQQNEKLSEVKDDPRLKKELNKTLPFYKKVKNFFTSAPTHAHMAPGNIREAAVTGLEIAEKIKEGAEKAEEHSKEIIEETAKHGDKVEHGSKTVETLKDVAPFTSVLGSQLASIVETMHIAHKSDQYQALRNISESAHRAHNLKAPEVKSDQQLAVLNAELNHLKQMKRLDPELTYLYQLKDDIKDLDNQIEQSVDQPIKQQQLQAKKELLEKFLTEGKKVSFMSDAKANKYLNDRIKSTESSIRQRETHIKKAVVMNPMVRALTQTLSNNRDLQAERAAIAMSSAFLIAGTSIAAAGAAPAGLAAGAITSHMSTHTAAGVALKTSAQLGSEFLLLQAQGKIIEEVTDVAHEKLVGDENHHSPQQLNLSSLVSTDQHGNEKNFDIFENPKAAMAFLRYLALPYEKGAEHEDTRMELRKMMGATKDSDLPIKRKLTSDEKTISKALKSNHGISGSISEAVRAQTLIEQAKDINEIMDIQANCSKEARALMDANVVYSSENPGKETPKVDWLKLMFIADKMK
ncbi:hypothetical protein [Pleionea sp. CnH1-48]|uniref:hypothetical protein n=1 Tax=Pleionea sp. CnH1-48 TaxID=2954494 RepID=UPI00209827A4|nr:hypothetical protein [Pleionea sp. CnH1-48]MCO7224858.1 hypothetical protein [Pleionea sp. CnH1-48]